MQTGLQDAQLHIRPYTLDDAEYHLAHEDKEIEKWLSGGKSTLEGVKNWINRNQEYWEKGGPVFNFAVVNNDVLVGMVEANSDRTSIPELEEGDANISYALFPEARGKGYAARAVNLLLEFLAQRGFKKAVIRVEPQNLASQSVPTRLGFTKQEPIDPDQKFTMYVKELEAANEK